MADVDLGDSTQPGAARTRAWRWLALLAFTIHLLLLVRPDASFFSRPFQEDAFYSLSVAHSLADGKGLSIDGVQKTNGVQPLVCFLDAPLFAIAGDDVALALRLVLLLQVAILLGAAMAIAWFTTTLLRDRSARAEIFWLVTAVVGWSYMLINGMLNGLETGLSTGLVFAAAAYYNSRIAAASERAGLGRFALLGILLGLGVLARIDEAFLVACLIAWHAWCSHRRYGRLPGAERFAAFRRLILECMVMGGMSVVISAPWWIYNVVEFGSLVPISGQAQQLLFPDRWNNLMAALRTIADSFLVLVSTPHGVARISWLLGAGIAALAALAALWFTHSFGLLRRVAAAWRRQWNVALATPVLLFGIALLCYYIIFFGAPHFIVRYLVPLRVLIVLGVVTLVYLFWKSAPRRSPVRIAVTGLVLLALGGSAFGLSWNFADRNTNIYMFPARWITEHTLPADRIGMFQSGTTGFLHRNVVNLDGKVNVGALRALQEHRMPAYIDSMRFDYLIDWAPYVEPVLADPILRGRYRPVDTLVADFIVWRRIR
ncbi:MAG TPA: hypothetical protein VHI13_01905 [Candidatus Kapabacteria bacterium]|nr:hypothetical protein [Candidatus Kapabacteria bacterium]